MKRWINTEVISQWNEKTQQYETAYSEGYWYEGDVALAEGGNLPDNPVYCNCSLYFGGSQCSNGNSCMAGCCETNGVDGIFDGTCNPDSCWDPPPGSGGGGKTNAGESQTDAGTSRGSNGGDGATNNYLTGSNITYAGGGGGAGGTGGHPGQVNKGSGGAGGGGNGGRYAGSSSPQQVQATSGTANTGGGGGGGGSINFDQQAGNGGSGIVILRYAGGQVATGGTVTSSGGFTFHTFTSSGTFTT